MKSTEAPVEGHLVRLADLDVDMLKHTVRRAGKRLPVNGRSFLLLAFLIERYPETAGHRELMEGVWKGVVVTPDALSQRVRLLRKALGEPGGETGYIVSVHGQGYRLAEPPQRGAVSGEPLSGGRRLNTQARWLALALVGCLLAAILVFPDLTHMVKHFFKHHLG